MLRITTAYSLHREEDFVLRPRKRPKGASQAAQIARKEFGSAAVQEMRIPCAINDYNHGKGHVDQANSLRTTFSCHRPFNNKWWKPVLWWLIDISHVNAFVVYRRLFDVNNKDRSLHSRFFSQLVDSLLTSPLGPQEVFYSRTDSEHAYERSKQCRQCAVCSEQDSPKVLWC